MKLSTSSLWALVAAGPAERFDWCKPRETETALVEVEMEKKGTWSSPAEF